LLWFIAQYSRSSLFHMQFYTPKLFVKKWNNTRNF
jgi:hypothetical protein